MTFAHCFHLGPLKEQRCFLFRITVAEHCVWALLLFSSSALSGRPIDDTRTFEGANTIAESGILLSMQQGVHISVAEFVLYPVLQYL